MSNAMAQAPHIPVLLTEVVHALAVTPGQMIVDGTFGAGGYTRALLAAGAIVHAFDRDPDAISEGAELVAASEGRLTLHHAPFSAMESHLAAAGVTAVAGVTLDIGVSSMQLDRAERGFSFQGDGPLDMRMSQEGASAADFVNTADEGAIADVLYHYGEERQSRRVARAIVAARPFARTGELANVIRRVLGWHPGMPKDPATRSFQAIRIHINRELDELKDALSAAERLLRPGGRLVIVSFHSLEDRIVKQFMRDRSGGGQATSRHVPIVVANTPVPTFEKPSKAVRAGDTECSVNPRARSAVLRGAIRTDAASDGRLAA
jgi:16S rRNA (cytosine1402-N4)-methyltransferase